MIEEEIAGAEEYAKCALKYKADMPELASAFSRMSHDEIGHVNLLHKNVVKIIDDYRRENGEPPEAMLAVYNFLHERQIENMAKVKTIQNMYNE